MSIGAPPQGTPPAMTSPGSIVSLLDGLVALQAALVNSPDFVAYTGYKEDLTFYRWRPDSVELPAVYNWMLPSTSEMKDLSRIRDSIGISTRIGVRFADMTDRMSLVEVLADSYRALVDPSYWNGQQLQPAVQAFATWAIRSQMQSFSEEIGSTPVVGIEFVQTFWLDRHV